MTVVVRRLVAVLPFNRLKDYDVTNGTLSMQSAHLRSRLPKAISGIAYGLRTEMACATDHESMVSVSRQQSSKYSVAGGIRMSFRSFR
jgi:hypothetical protein